jgi:hypothetical protein
MSVNNFCLMLLSTGSINIARSGTLIFCWCIYCGFMWHNIFIFSEGLRNVPLSQTSTFLIRNSPVGEKTCPGSSRNRRLYVSWFVLGCGRSTSCWRRCFPIPPTPCTTLPTAGRRHTALALLTESIPLLKVLCATLRISDNKSVPVYHDYKQLNWIRICWICN